MMRCRTREVAAAFAMEKTRANCFGLSVFPDSDGRAAWFVGEEAELRRVGVSTVERIHCASCGEQWPCSESDRRDQSTAVRLAYPSHRPA